jgi:D-arabinose 1-dehydrogenase-like Zn-dependent alcohol dehydrogenase
MLTLASAASGILSTRIQGEWIAVLGIVGGVTLAMVSTVMAMIRSILVARAREQSRREIAAYVAEGSISAEDAARLLEAGRSVLDLEARRHGWCCGKKHGA